MINSARAENEHRSIAQEVVHLFDQAIQKTQPLSIMALQGLGNSTEETSTRHNMSDLNVTHGTD